MRKNLAKSHTMRLAALIRHTLPPASTDSLRTSTPTTPAPARPVALLRKPVSGNTD
jgi:hypothetical protein